MSVRLESDNDTQNVGGRLAAACRGGTMIYLKGQLGAGKTTLVRGFLRRLGYTGPVKSPTYTLVEAYEVDDLIVYHLDLYRIGDPMELEYVGVRDLLSNDAVCLVEWPECGAGVLPPADLIVELDYVTHGRSLSFHALTSAGREIVDLLERE